MLTSTRRRAVPPSFVRHSTVILVGLLCLAASAVAKPPPSHIVKPLPWHLDGGKCRGLPCEQVKCETDFCKNNVKIDKKWIEGDLLFEMIQFKMYEKNENPDVKRWTSGTEILVRGQNFPSPPHPPQLIWSNLGTVTGDPTIDCPFQVTHEDSIVEHDCTYTKGNITLSSEGYYKVRFVSEHQIEGYLSFIGVGSTYFDHGYPPIDCNNAVIHNQWVELPTFETCSDKYEFLVSEYHRVPQHSYYEWQFIGNMTGEEFYVAGAATSWLANPHNPYGRYTSSIIFRPKNEMPHFVDNQKIDCPFTITHPYSSKKTPECFWMDKSIVAVMDDAVQYKVEMPYMPEGDLYYQRYWPGGEPEDRRQAFEKAPKDILATLKDDDDDQVGAAMTDENTQHVSSALKGVGLGCHPFLIWAAALFTTAFTTLQRL